MQPNNRRASERREGRVDRSRLQRPHGSNESAEVLRQLRKDRSLPPRMPIQRIGLLLLTKSEFISPSFFISNPAVQRVVISPSCDSKFNSTHVLSENCPKKKIISRFEKVTMVPALNPEFFVQSQENVSYDELPKLKKIS